MMDVVAAGLDELRGRIAGRFGRAEPRARVREYVSGLVAGLERKNGWTLAEWAGEVSPDGMQRLLRRADWDVDGVRDDVRAYVVDQLGEPDGVLIADDTGFLKKGTRSAGVQRQYSGTAGRTENCQVGVFLAYASAHGHALIDRELYLPQSWTEDPERCRAAGIPDEVEFVTKPRQAQAMIGRAVAAGVPFAWFTADEVYGQAKWLRAWLEGQDVSYVMAIRCSDTLTMTEGQRRAGALIAAVPARGWQRDLGRGRGAWPAGVRLGPDPGPGRLEARPRALAAGSPLAERSGGDRLLRVLRAAAVQHRRPGVDRGQPVAHRSRPPLLSVKRDLSFTAALLVFLPAFGRFLPGVVPSGRGCSSRAGGPCARGARASAARRR